MLIARRSKSSAPSPDKSTRKEPAEAPQAGVADGRPYTEKVAAALKLFDASTRSPIASGSVPRTTVRIRQGFAASDYTMPAPMPEELPDLLTSTLNDGGELRVHPVARNAAGKFAALPVLFVLWTPPRRFCKESKWRHEVLPEARESIRAALKLCPAPSLLVEAGPEIWAAWKLVEPIRDKAEADKLLGVLASRLGTVGPDDLLRVHLAAAGTVRSWNTAKPDRIRLSVDSELRGYLPLEVVGVP